VHFKHLDIQNLKDLIKHLYKLEEYYFLVFLEVCFVDYYYKLLIRKSQDQ
jgi:hypothetical protein